MVAGTSHVTPRYPKIATPLIVTATDDIAAARNLIALGVLTTRYSSECVYVWKALLSVSAFAMLDPRPAAVARSETPDVEPDKVDNVG